MMNNSSPWDVHAHVHCEDVNASTQTHACTFWHTFNGESGLHASMDVVGHVTVEQPSPRDPCHHLHGLESPGEEVKDVRTVHTVRLTHAHTHTKDIQYSRGEQKKGNKHLL